MSKKLGIAIILLIIFAGSVYYLGFEKATVLVVSGSVSVGRSGGEIFELTQYDMTTRVQAEVRQMAMFNYMMTQRGRARVTGSNAVELPDVVNLTIIFRLTTPTNKSIEFEPLKLGKGGVHNFTFIIGESEGVSGDGTFKLEIVFKLRVTTPNGITVVDMERTITVLFELSEKSLQVQE